MLITSIPRNNSYGTDDQSGTTEPPLKIERPRFLPHFFFAGEKGTLEKNTVNYAKAKEVYGAETFNMDSKFYRHPTVFAEGVFSKTGLCEFERIVDPSLRVNSNVTVWIDIALDDLPEYKRNHDGSYVIGEDGNAETTGETIEGYKYKIYYSYITDETADADKDGRDMYEESVQAGYMTDKNDETSTMYPLFTFIGNSLGEVLNKEGFTISPLTKDDADQEMLDTLKVFPYIFKRYSIYTDVRKPVNHIFGSNDVKFALSKNVKHPTTRIKLNLDSYIPSYWTNTTDYTAPMKYSDFDEPIVYYDNIETVSGILFEKEAPHVTTEVKTWDDGLDAASSEWFDFAATEDGADKGQELLFNILTGVSTNEVNYFTFINSSDETETDSDTNETTVSAAVTIYLNGGSDGDLTDELFETVVRSKLADYLDRDNIINEQSLNPESVLIDSGYTLETSLAFANILTHRRDLVPVISVHEVNLKDILFKLDEEIAILQLIRNRFKLFPESAYYGTEQSKTIVCLGTGKIKGSPYPYRVPLTYDLVLKMTEMMGSSNGKWKKAKNFSGFNHSGIKYLEDVKIGTLPTPTYSTVPLLWKYGATWAQTKDKGIHFTPAVQTIYDDATSVLNNPVTAFAISVIEKAHENCWEEHSGTTDMSNVAFAESVEKFMRDELDGVFDGVVKVTSKCIITALDELLGYSYNLVSTIEANNMKTAQYSHLIAKRAGE